MTSLYSNFWFVVDLFFAGDESIAKKDLRVIIEYWGWSSVHRWPISLDGGCGGQSLGGKKKSGFSWLNFMLHKAFFSFPFRAFFPENLFVIGLFVPRIHFWVFSPVQVLIVIHCDYCSSVGTAPSYYIQLKFLRWLGPISTRRNDGTICRILLFGVEMGTWRYTFSYRDGRNFEYLIDYLILKTVHLVHFSSLRGV